MPEPSESNGWIVDVQHERIDYDTDLIKHYVRMRGWLPVSLTRNQSIKGRRTRYFTLCAANAIDVFLLERARVLRRTSDGKLTDSYFCEYDAVQFREIERLIRGPRQGFLGSLEDIVLFEESDSTRGRTRTDPGSGKITTRLRQELDRKEKHYRLASAFPFDILNLDVTGTLFPPSQPQVSRLMKTILRLLEWQTNKPLSDDGRRIESFAILLTIHIDEGIANYEAVASLSKMIEHNIDNIAAFRDRWHKSFPGVPPSDLASSDFERFFSIALPKYLIEKGLSLGWDVVCEGRFLYRRRSTYTMMCEMLTFSRLLPLNEERLFRIESSRSNQQKQADERVVEEVWKAPIWPENELANGSVRDEVKADLEQVIEFRDRIRARHTS